MKDQIKRILIVEDEMIIALMIERMIDMLGHQTIGKVVSGEQAVEAALELKPDIILMDIRLKGKMDGIEAMKEINKQVNIPVIYVSGNNDTSSQKRLQDVDFVDFLIKPISLHDLDRSFSKAS